MFTGLVSSTGTVISTAPMTDGMALVVQLPPHIIESASLGDSMSINGVCTTITEFNQDTITVHLLRETLNKTTLGTLMAHDLVNIEPCLTLQTKLGGHLVSGHIDDTGTITTFDRQQEWAVMTIEFSDQFSPFIIEKGSIAIDGISLTVVDAGLTSFSCHLIPHTQQTTTLHTKQTGDKVNLEFDQIGKYLHRFWSLQQPND